jgi:peptidoglycan/xylan/chitin deacetylase (PgdA/CDA1 family)
MLRSKREVVKRALADVLHSGRLHSVVGRALSWSGVLILTYHRVGEAGASLFDRGLWSADAETFARQIRLCKTHLDLITPADLPNVVRSGRGRYGLITFDDGYRDNYETAFPILRAEKVPATFFIATGFLDDPRLPWWDEIAWMVRSSRQRSVDLRGFLAAPVTFDEPARERAIRTVLRAYKTAPAEAADRFLDAVAEATGTGRSGGEHRDLWMTWDMVRAMRAAGMTIGGHTVAHPVLAGATRERQREEVFGCGRRLSEELGEPMLYFSYPVGGRRSFNGVTRECLREAGVRYAFSYYGKFRRFSDWDDYDVRRVPVESDLRLHDLTGILRVPQFFT